MTWTALYQDATGRLLSVGTVVADQLPAGTVAVVLAEKPRRDQMWDSATRSFVPRPAKVLVDRLVDLRTRARYADFRDVYQRLSAADRTKVRDALALFLGRARYRNQAESDVVEPDE